MSQHPTAIMIKSYELPLMEIPYYAAHKYLLLYVPPFLLVVGTFGNVFSFLILRKAVKKISIYSYLSVLAVMDLAVLYIGLLRLWIGQLQDDMENMSDWLCKLVVFLGYVTSDISVWLIVAVTVERFLVVYFPLHAPRICQVKQARIAILVIFLVYISINLHFLWSVGLITTVYNETVIVKCSPVESYKQLVVEIWPWVDAALYSFAPFVVIIILNCLIIRQIFHARRTRCDMQLYSFRPAGSTSKLRQRPDTLEVSKRLTLMLLAVSFTFLLTTLPMNLTVILTKAVWSDPESDEEFAKITFIKTVTELLMYTNHSINFFLYCATGRKFRKRLRTLFCYVCSGRFGSRFRGNSGRLSVNFRLYNLHSSSGPRTIYVDYNNAHRKGTAM